MGPGCAYFGARRQTRDARTSVNTGKGVDAAIPNRLRRGRRHGGGCALSSAAGRQRHGMGRLIHLLAAVWLGSASPHMPFCHPKLTRTPYCLGDLTVFTYVRVAEMNGKARNGYFVPDRPVRFETQ